MNNVVTVLVFITFLLSVYALYRSFVLEEEVCRLRRQQIENTAYIAALKKYATEEVARLKVQEYWRSK